MKKKNKKIVIGLGSLGLLVSTMSFGTVLQLINKNNNVVNNTIEQNSVKSQKNSESINQRSFLSTRNYTPVISTQHSAASTTYDGYIGYGVGDNILDRNGSVISMVGGKTTDDRRAIYFTTFDGVLRWKFDLNELNNHLSFFDADTDQLRIVDIKPLHNYDNKNNGYMVLTAATGYTKASQSFGTNVLFILDEFGNIVEDSINEFELPTFGVTSARNLIGNTATNTNIISPYSIKLSYSSKTKALVQISANPFAIKTNNMAYKWKLSEYLSQEADAQSFNVDPNSIEKTTPIVLLEYDYVKKSFVYEDATSEFGRKILKNYSLSSKFEKFVNQDTAILPEETYILSEMMFYVKSNVLGFYGAFLTPGADVDSRKFNVSMYTLDNGKFTLDNIVFEYVITDVSGEFRELFDFKNYSNDYSGYTYSYIPLNYNGSYNSPCATLILPFSGGVEQGFYFIQIFDQLKSNYKKITNWITDDEKRIPRASFIDPIYGNIFIPTSNGSEIQYIDTTYEGSNGVSIPNQFNSRTLKLTNHEIFVELLNQTSSIFPISTTNNIYDENNSYYSKFAFASFSNNGTYDVLYFNTDNSNNSVLTKYPETSEKYQLLTYTDLQKRSEELGWTPKKKKLSEISESRLNTIGDYTTVSTSTPIDKLPLFYLSLVEGQKQLYPLNKLTVSNVVKDYNLARLEFIANFSYPLYASTEEKVYSQRFEINDFKKDSTLLENTTFNIPSLNNSGSPLIVASPISYQGEYNEAFDYLSGQQVAITNKNKTLVYQLKKNKPSSISLFNKSGIINNTVLNEYFEVVKDINDNDQTPYEPTQVNSYKGMFSSYVTYQRGDVVKDEVTNKLFIFKSASNNLSDAVLFQGTDLSTLLPTEVTDIQIAMIVKSKMVFGTIPDGFNLDSILVSTVNRNNLGTTDINNGNAVLTADIKLKRYIDEQGQLQTNSSNFPTTHITINFNDKSKPTNLQENYNVKQFDGLLNNMYAYELDVTFIQKNPEFFEKIIQINREEGNISNDISSANIEVASTQAYNKEGQVQMQVYLSRWYDENGTLQTSELKYVYINISGFKSASATEFSKGGNVNLRSDQLNVPGLGGLMPQDVTVDKFISDPNNVKEFILNYVFIEDNKKLLIDSARPANFGYDSINIVSTIPNQAEGSVNFVISFNSYFVSKTINGSERIVYRQGSSDTFNLSISGFKKYIDNSVDNFKYDATININSSLKDSPSWPSSLRFSISKPTPIPIVFYEENKNNIDSILKQAIFATFSTPQIDGNKNNSYIDGFTLADVGAITSCYYNNFTGKIVFKANLKKIVSINDEGIKTTIDNSNIGDWSTNERCRYSISLDGFKKVEVSKVDGQEITAISSKNDAINLESSIQVNQNSLNINLSDVENLIKWSGDFGVFINNKLVISTMDEIIANNATNPFVDSISLDKNVITGKVQIIYEFTKPVYYFANKNDYTNQDDPYLLGNLGTPIELTKGSKIVITLTSVKKFNIWEIVFYVAVAVVGIILLSLIIFLIARAINNRRLYR